jgi:dTDP-4-dehydrorhamnose reductase
MILLTGGSGCLGRELVKGLDCVAPSRRDFDITSKESISDWIINNGIPNLIVHCAAYTDVLNAEKMKDLCYTVNVRGTSNLADIKIPMVYISTEYVFDGEKGNYSEDDVPNPKNFYSLTKLLGEFEAKRTKSLIIRTLLKPRPFEHTMACTNQYTTGDYVDIIAREILIAISSFNNCHNIFTDGIINIGTGRKSTFQLASQTKNVKPTTVEAIGVRLPKDTSLNLTRWINYKGKL